MEQINPPKKATKITEIVAGVNLVEVPYEVKVPIFQEVKVDKPVFVEKQIEVPAGYDKVINALALELSEKILSGLLVNLDKKLSEAIDSRIKEIKYPKLIEEVTVTHKEVEVEKPVFKDVEVERPVFKDKEIINPVTKDVEVVNAIVIDKPVVNCVVTDIKVTNAIIKDVEVERAVIREKVVDVIHPRYLDMKGNPA